MPDLGASAAADSAPGARRVAALWRLWTNIAAADADLTRRARMQLTRQAVCSAAYAKEVLGLDVAGEDVLVGWCAVCEREGKA